MAIVFSVFISLCIVISSIGPSVASETKYFEYSIDDAIVPQSNDITSVVRLKRQAFTPVLSKNATDDAESSPPSSYGELPATKNGAGGIKINSDATLLVMGNSSSEAAAADDTAAAADKSYATLMPTDRPLLGANGTGQRRDPSATLLKARPTQLSAESTGTTNMDEVINSIDVSSDNDTETLLAKEHNLTVVIKDFLFYNSSTQVDMNRTKAEWINVKNMAANGLLSQSHRRAITVQLSFDFPFYGHPVRNVTVATGGFLYTGEYVHSWLAATQYIAPLMANFDTSISNDSFVKLYDNGTCFTVLWENVSLQDNRSIGTFTFSVSLHKSGQIVFTYFAIPTQVSTIQDDKHPVKIGLSDAYIIDKTIVFARRKTIYEYHRVNFESADISNNTVITLTANPTCHSLTDCLACITELATFKCSWCPATNKCSTGMDRNRQDWVQRGCENSQIRDGSVCPAIGTKGNNYGAEQTYSVNGSDVADRFDESAMDTAATRRKADNSNSKINNNDVHIKSVASPFDDDASNAENVGAGMFLGLFLPILLISVLALWIFYAYRNPHTKSGQLLIQYRPSQWSWRKGEARYTAATVHM